MKGMYDLLLRECHTRIKMSVLYFRDISFGKTDASNELIEAGRDFYVSSFLEFEKYRIEEFLSGKRYFITGRKGTGKTALLKYLECRFSENPENMVIPIRFKSDFGEADKKDVRAASTNVGEIIEKEVNGSIKSYVTAWQSYLIYQVFKHAESNEGEYSVFQKNKEYDVLWRLLKLVYGENGGNRIVPRIKKGCISASVGTKGIDASLAVEIGLNEDKIDYELTVRKIIELFNQMVFDRTHVFILVDELELSIKTKKLRDTDIELIRDLILAIDMLNRVSKMKGYDIKLYASVRTDVLNSVLSSGYEINKCIEDYGIKVEWYQKGGDSYNDSPLIKLLEKKIIASEKAKGVDPSNDVWKTYFEPVINRLEIKKYLLTNSWYRPRDIIRLMDYAQRHSGSNLIKVNQEVFDRAIQDYSSGMWSEIKEELSLRYEDNEIRAIEKLFTGVEVPFSKKYLEDRMTRLAENYTFVEEFKKKHKLSEVLELLFELGIVGNSGERMVFSFLDYKDFDILKPMIIHTPLRNFFEVVSKKKENSNKE